MTDDVLARATRALRAETNGDDAGARFTRSRIMASVHDERVKRRTRWAFLLPIAATFVAASAYGAATGKTREAFEVVVRALGVHRSAPPVPTATAPRARERAKAATPAEPPPVAAAPAVLEVPTPPEPVTLPVAPVAPVSAPRAPAPAAKVAVGPNPASAVAPSSTSLPGVGGAAADPTFELYRTAHQTHFVERDYARALESWDAYLRAAPNGSLVPEARYNRALCLVRLHRNDEARVALTPFAEGRYGTYRRADAEKLISALPGGLAGPIAP
jgi:hypothetical protein